MPIDSDIIKHIEFELFLREHSSIEHTTKSGKKIRVVDMTTEHLKNTLKWYEQYLYLKEIIDENSTNIY